MLKKNNEKRKWYFLIAVALIVGAMIGYFATNMLSTRGFANYSVNSPIIENINVSGDQIYKINGEEFIFVDDVVLISKRKFNKIVKDCCDKGLNVVCYGNGTCECCCPEMGCRLQR